MKIRPDFVYDRITHVNDRATITFYGGAGTVTGANFLFDIGDKKILVDCGALEREYTCDPANSMPFDYDPKDIDVLIITHAHADHIGRVPKLVQGGFNGIIYSTAATKDLAALMFDDAITVMHTEAEKHGCPVLYEKKMRKKRFRSGRRATITNRSRSAVRRSNYSMRGTSSGRQW